MIIRKESKRRAVKESLLRMLKKDKAFWSYSNESVTIDSIGDDQLIAFTMRYLDLEEIKLLFCLYSKVKIKSAWKRLLVPEGKYLYTLNRFFAWYYFKAKNPDAYLKTLETRHLNRIIASTL